MEAVSTPTGIPGTDGASGRGSRHRRGLRLLTAASVVFASLVAVVGAGVATSEPAAAAKGPNCSFSPHALGPLVTDVTAGDVIHIACAGLPKSTEFLQVELSLLTAIDPNASTLLTGGSVTSVSGLLALIATVPEINALSEAFVSSDSTGALTTNYTIPSTQPTDPNATCPPSTEELNSGLIGCAIAMIDLSTFKPVTAGTFVTSYAGDPLFPAGPTLALTPAIANPGQTVQVSDAPGATTYWWLATLESLEALLGSGHGASSYPVKIHVGGARTKSTANVTPASYNNITFTPPKLSGSFIAHGRGKRSVKAILSANLLGFQIQNVAVAPMKVLGRFIPASTHASRRR
jgi:hypothetical protein